LLLVEDTLTQTLSQKLTSAAVSTAVLIKQSPIPDTLASFTSATLTTYNRLDSAFNIQDKIVEVGQGVVKTSMVASGIAATALLKAGIAYQVTPGYRDIKGQQSSNPTSPTSGSSSTSLLTDGSSSGGGGGFILGGMNAGAPMGGPVTVLRISTLPGSLPLPDLMEMSTQTDSEITQFYVRPSDGGVIDLGVGMTGYSDYPGSVLDGAGGTDEVATKERKSNGGGGILRSVASLSSLTSAITSSSSSKPQPQSSQQQQPNQRQLQKKPSTTLVSTVLNTTGKVASSILTTSSNYVLGKGTTTKLIGVITGDEEKIHYEEGQEEEQKLLKESDNSNSKNNAEAGNANATTGKRSSTGTTGYNGPIRNLMVGGVLYVTAISTLTKVPGSRLAKWFGNPSTLASPSTSSATSSFSSGAPTQFFSAPSTSTSTLPSSAASTYSSSSSASSPSSSSSTIPPASVIPSEPQPYLLPDGTLFIDRDGTLFRYILNHLRGLSLPEEMEDMGTLKELRREAVYYDLVALVVEIDERLMELEEILEEEKEEMEFEREREREMERELEMRDVDVDNDDDDDDEMVNCSDFGRDFGHGSYQGDHEKYNHDDDDDDDDDLTAFDNSKTPTPSHKHPYNNNNNNNNRIPLSNGPSRQQPHNQGRISSNGRPRRPSTASSLHSQTTTYTHQSHQTGGHLSQISNASTTRLRKKYMALRRPPPGGVVPEDVVRDLKMREEWNKMMRSIQGGVWVSMRMVGVVVILAWLYY
jgi:hypothetical protein